MINAHNSKVIDCNLIELPKVSSGNGDITAVNNLKQIPFEVKRVYYLFDVPDGETRGGHAHKKLHQVIIAASGSFNIVLDDGFKKRSINLYRPNKAVYLPPGLWRELNNFSAGSICLVLASQEYLEEDYIRNYNEFKLFKKNK